MAQGRGLVGPVREEACEAVRDALLEHSGQFFSPRREDELFAAGARVLDRLLPRELNPRGLWVERQCPWWSHDHQDPDSRSGGTRHQRQRPPFLLAAEGNSFLEGFSELSFFAQEILNRVGLRNSTSTSWGYPRKLPV